MPIPSTLFLFEEKPVRIKYVAATVLSILFVASLYHLWQDAEWLANLPLGPWVVGIALFAIPWLICGLMVVVIQWFKYDAVDRPNPVGTRWQQRMFWRTLLWGPFMIILIAFEENDERGTPKPFSWRKIFMLK